ncbi:hypothetical protein OSB04_012136 [Centaurea solstitialis]|uniref:Reverse transcriptase domain-containing protein n=1 Tax=Centaurea solstitialis TaxID=347529 RepID=A0AA38WEC3_9ASTR|nr:hypothetical protein OSB04_012136 [Centaurea solstitialis]
MSSPATMTSMEEFVMDNPSEGNRRGLKVDGSWVSWDPNSGFDRIKLFEPGSSEAQQTSPPEEEVGENPGGIKGNKRRCHVRVSGSKMLKDGVGGGCGCGGGGGFRGVPSFANGPGSKEGGWWQEGDDSIDESLWEFAPNPGVHPWWIGGGVGGVGWKRVREWKGGGDIMGMINKSFHWKKVFKVFGGILIALNGVTGGLFEGKHGIQQGDPISPFLFTIVMEGLSMILKRHILDAQNFGYHNGCEDLDITHLCFAYDFFVFTKGDLASVEVLKRTLEMFASCSGLSQALRKGKFSLEMFRMTQSWKFLR